MYVKEVMILKDDKRWHYALHIGGFDKDKDGNIKTDFLLTEKGQVIEIPHAKLSSYDKSRIYYSIVNEYDYKDGKLCPRG